MLKLVKNFLILNLCLAAFVKLSSWACEQYYLKYFMLNSLGLLITLMLVHLLRALGPRRANLLLVGIGITALLSMLGYVRSQFGTMSTMRLEFLLLSFTAHAVPYLIVALIYLRHNLKGIRLLSLILSFLGITCVSYGLLLEGYPDWAATGGRFIYSAGIFLLMAVCIIPLAWIKLPHWAGMRQTPS